MTKSEAIAKYHALEATVAELTEEVRSLRTSNQHLDAMLDVAQGEALSAKAKRYGQDCVARAKLAATLRIRNPFYTKS